jgi:hypothetical protein
MRVRHWASTPPVNAASTPTTPAAQKQQLKLNTDDYFVHKRIWCLGFSVWAVKSRSISWLATALNLYLLLNAVRALHAFNPLGTDEYAITELASADACLRSRKLQEAAAAAAIQNVTAPSPPQADSMLLRVGGMLASGLREAAETLTHEVHDAKKAVFADDLASIMRNCRNELSQAAPPGLAEAKLFYFSFAYGLVAAALVLDLLRLCGCCASITDAILGYRSARAERFRLLPQLCMIVPFLHLTWLLSRPLELPCCIGTPKIGCVGDRVRVLAWLSLLVSYCLFSDAHNHGFFLLRSTEASACRLLRPSLSHARIPGTTSAGDAGAWCKV